MKKIYKIASVFLIAASLTSCENYFDVNTDPNNPLVESTNPEIVLPGAMTTTGATLTSRMNRLGNLMVGNWGGNVLNFSGPFDAEFKYDLTSSFYNDVWDNLMVRTVNYTNIINYSGDGQNYNNHKAVAQIMRAFYFQYLVDMYGDIPYFGKHLATEGLNPAYDDAQVIYRDLVTELNAAIALIDASAGSNALPLGASDVMKFGPGSGSMDDWKKFANTIKLRVLLRQSNMTDADTQNHITSELAGMSSADFVNTNVTLNPGYSNDSSNGKQNPFYATYGFATNGSFAGTSNSLVAPTVYAIELLDGINTGIQDPRLSRLWTAEGNPNTHQGLEQGQLLAGLPLGGDTVLSRLGAGLGVDVASDAGASQDAYIMTAAEALFLQAEAVERGYITGASQALFEQGIRSSFNLLGLFDADDLDNDGNPDNTVSDYITASANTNTLGWNGSANKYEAIAQQKFTALMSINGAEAWIEYSRTGFPTDLPISLTETSGGLRPVRLLYPASELSGNSANVPSQTTSTGFTSKIFWDVN